MLARVGWMPLSALHTLHAFLCTLVALCFADAVDFQPSLQVHHIDIVL